ncbi:histidine triad nucleotide-binding protein [Histidinibacterium aquaticum]|uniref:Histidine triad nucleotide-binding protein n=1 Tax=Histidinibacterium aquaticum TaxID=2613962 RepID=A0A5J5GR78_9RHOB|nr:histidine triad nucleotide-binding protein [Histidinibacterium aquaticum]KAA9010577.1 histidine triad nucleotide-binding protein [Histidinibacterium aquaticum]
MPFDYDPENIFAKILRGEIPCDKVHETEHSLAFRDIRPQAPVHALVIPKGPYATLDHFCEEATDAEIVDFWRCVGQVCRSEGVEDGFRAIMNARKNGVQEVPHLHVHILGGRPMGRMLDPA